MKRITSCFLSVIIALSAGITALAAESKPEVIDVYNDSTNSVSANEAGVVSGYSTVMIKTIPEGDAESEVVYINQASEGFSVVTSFLMKDGCQARNYIATFGNATGGTKTIQFFKGDITVAGEKGDGNYTDNALTLNTSTKMTVADGATLQTDIKAKDADPTKYYKGFTLLVDNINMYDVAYLVSSDGTKCYGYFTLPEPYTVVADNTWVAYGLQVFNIDEDKKGLNLYLGKIKTSENETTGGASE